MARYVPWLVALWLMVLTERANGQAVQYSDQQAGDKIDILTPRGMGLAIKWHDRFWPQLMAVKGVVEAAENLLTTEYEASVRVNLTERMEAALVDVKAKLDETIAAVDALGYSNTDDDLIAYMKSPHSTMNIGDHFSGGVFTAPKQGLYQVLIRNGVGSGFSCTITRNGIETLATLENNSYFDVRTRIRLVWLNANDEIYTTGSTPSYFGILRLRMQTLMPDYLNH